MISEAAESEKMRLLAENEKKKATQASIEAASMQELGVTKEYPDEQSVDGDNPMEWIEVE